MSLDEKVILSVQVVTEFFRCSDNCSDLTAEVILSQRKGKGSL